MALPTNVSSFLATRQMLNFAMLQSTTYMFFLLTQLSTIALENLSLMQHAFLENSKKYHLSQNWLVLSIWTLVLPHKLHLWLSVCSSIVFQFPWSGHSCHLFQRSLLVLWHLLSWLVASCFLSYVLSICYQSTIYPRYPKIKVK